MPCGWLRADGLCCVRRRQLFRSPDKRGRISPVIVCLLEPTANRCGFAAPGQLAERRLEPFLIERHEVRCHENASDGAPDARMSHFGAADGLSGLRRALSGVK
jgi:hypothetical protein